MSELSIIINIILSLLFLIGTGTMLYSIFTESDDRFDSHSNFGVIKIKQKELTNDFDLIINEQMED